MGKIKGKFIENSTITEQQLSSSVNDSLDKADNSVQKTGNENIGGIKTFSSFPLTPSSAPTTDYQVVNKKYIDDNSSGISYSVVAGSITMEAKKGYIAYTGRWDISTASYDRKSFNIGGQEEVPASLFFKPDGSKVYVIGQSSNRIHQYSLSTAWDISTASYDNKSFNVGVLDDAASSVFFKPDGSKVYAVGLIDKTIHQYSLSTAWDISTASYHSKSFGIGSQDTYPMGLFFKPDGSKVYAVGFDSARIYQYSLSTAWDISTASYDSISFSLSSQDTFPASLFFKPDGSKVYVIGSNNAKIFQYSLSTAWDISTASYDSKSFSVKSQDNYPYGLFLKPDGSKVYAVGADSVKIHQYSLSDTELLLPSSASIGDEIKIYSKDVTKITQNANNKIINGSEETTTGTSGYFEVGSNQSVGLIYLGGDVWGVTEQHDSAVTGGITGDGIDTLSVRSTEPTSPSEGDVWIDASGDMTTAIQAKLDAKVDGTTKITVASTSPSSPSVGDIWVDTSGW